MVWRFHPIRDFDAHAQDWRALNERGANSPLLDPMFVAPLIREFAAGDEVLAVCTAGARIVAMGLFQRATRVSWQTFQPANAPLGPWLGERGLDLEACLASLLRALPCPAVLVGVTQIDPDITPRPGDTTCLRTSDYITTARISVTGGFDDYWNQRGKNLRHNTKRQLSRLTREGVAARFEVLRDGPDMARAVADYAALESLGWKARIDSAVGAEDAQGRFYSDMLRAFAEQGQAAVYRYFYGDALVASDICIERGDTMIVLKTAHDPDRKGTSPAQLMRCEMFRHAFDSGRFAGIEFYGPVMDWHTRWTEDVRTIYHVNLFRWAGAAEARELVTAWSRSRERPSGDATPKTRCGPAGDNRAAPGGPPRTPSRQE